MDESEEGQQTVKLSWAHEPVKSHATLPKNPDPKIALPPSMARKGRQLRQYDSKFTNSFKIVLEGDRIIEKEMTCYMNGRKGRDSSRHDAHSRVVIYGLIGAPHGDQG
jgi:hypothetical protein